MIIGDDRHRVAWLLLGCCRGLLDDLHLPVNAENLQIQDRGVPGSSGPCAASLPPGVVEDLARRTLRHLIETGMPFRRPMLARMASQKPCRPQFVRIAQFRCLAAGQRHQPSLGLSGDCRLLAGAGHRELPLRAGEIDPDLRPGQSEADRPSRRLKVGCLFGGIVGLVGLVKTRSRLRAPKLKVSELSELTRGQHIKRTGVCIRGGDV